jgi:hypothetical protein
MFQELLPLLPKEPGTLPLILAMAGSLIGAGLWLAGARFSRSLVTLVFVSAGGWIGLLLPQWLGWNIDGWASAILLALLLGASGLLLHRFWVGVGLGLALGAWAATAIWIHYQGATAIPKVEAGISFLAYAQIFWNGLPVEMRRALAVGCGAALIGGVAATLLWPRICTVVFYSIVGVSMVVALGLGSINAARPQWLSALPNRASSQWLGMLCMVVFGALLQWKIAMSKKDLSPNPSRPMVVHS